jgi:DNA-binding CsgD family transcriptional regulator/tetratricopeptide (TPR) repeat protein
MNALGVPLPGPLQVPPSFSFVGRRAELARLVALWERVDEGRRVALIAGEPGVGKSRLVREFAHRVAAQGVVLYGDGDPTSGTSYQTVTEALAHLLRHTTPELTADDLGPFGGELPRLFPDLPARVPGLTAPALGSPETERHRLHTALVDLLAAVSAHTPVLLILDDLHWADASTLLLLRHLLRTRAEARLMVVGAFRDSDDEVGEPLADALADLARIPGVLRLQLGGLEAGDIAEFVERAGGRDLDAAGPQVTAALGGLTRGNPFLLGELWRHLVETGVLDRTADGWRRIGTITNIGTPDGIRQVVGQRLSRLTPGTRTLLETAAVAGPEVDLGLLRGAVDLDESTLLTALEEALRTGMVQQTPGPRPTYRFTHELVRRSVCDRLNPVAGARLHLQVAEALERVPGDDPRVLADLAAHFTAAAPLGTAERAVTHSLRAAEAATHRFAFDQAAELLQNALDLGVPEPERGRVQLRLGAALRAAGRWAMAVTSYRAAAEVARQKGDTVLLADAALGLEETCWRPGITSAGAVSLLAEAVTAVGPRADRLTVRLLAALTRAHGYAGDWPQAAAARRAGVALARTLDDPATLACALAQSYWGRGVDDAGEILGALDEALTLAHGLRDPELMCTVHTWRIPLQAEMGRLDAARRGLEEFRATAEQLGQSVLLYHCEQAQSAIALAHGRLDEAEMRAENALELSRDGRYDAGGAHGIQMFSIRREQGRLAELEPVVRLVRAQGGRFAVWRPGLAVLYAELGMRADALAEIARLCADGFAEIADDALRTAALTYLADACAVCSDARHAALVYDELAPFAGSVVVVAGLVAYYGALDRYLGTLAACTGDWAAAEQHFVAATALNERLRMPTWLARTRHEHARMLLARAGPGDDVRGREMLAQARREAVRHGLTGLCAAIDSAMAGHSNERPDGLTRREVEVLRLVARGQSNREIGKALYISQNTAANHIRSILMKTGSVNRTEAAAFAHRHGLVVEGDSEESTCLST